MHCLHYCLPTQGIIIRCKHSCADLLVKLIFVDCISDSINLVKDSLIQFRLEPNVWTDSIYQVRNLVTAIRHAILYLWMLSIVATDRLLMSLRSDNSDKYRCKIIYYIFAQSNIHASFATKLKNTRQNVEVGIAFVQFVGQMKLFLIWASQYHGLPFKLSLM